jgi:RNA polymerase sigma-70 factor (ECF subfamily)
VAHDQSLAGLGDETLVERCQAGDHEAFTELVERYKHRVHWVVRRMIGGPDDEDLTQEVFLRAYQGLADFRYESKLSTWIYKIARNLCLSELRKRARQGEHVSMEEGEEKVHRLLPESGHGLEEQIEREDISRKVRALIERLPVHYKTVLTLYHLNHVSYEEIAEIMEVPLGTVKTYLHRARLRLRDLVLAESGLAELAGESGAEAARNGG